MLVNIEDHLLVIHRYRKRQRKHLHNYELLKFLTSCCGAMHTTACSISLYTMRLHTFAF